MDILAYRNNSSTWVLNGCEPSGGHWCFQRWLNGDCQNVWTGFKASRIRWLNSTLKGGHVKLPSAASSSFLSTLAIFNLFPSNSTVYKVLKWSGHIICFCTIDKAHRRAGRRLTHHGPTNKMTLPNFWGTPANCSWHTTCHDTVQECQVSVGVLFWIPLWKPETVNTRDTFF